MGRSCEGNANFRKLREQASSQFHITSFGPPAERQKVCRVRVDQYPRGCCVCFLRELPANLGHFCSGGLEARWLTGTHWAKWKRRKIRWIKLCRLDKRQECV